MSETFYLTIHGSPHGYGFALQYLLKKIPQLTGVSKIWFLQETPFGYPSAGTSSLYSQDYGYDVTYPSVFLIRFDVPSGKTMIQHFTELGSYGYAEDYAGRLKNTNTPFKCIINYSTSGFVISAAYPSLDNTVAKSWISGPLDAVFRTDYITKNTFGTVLTGSTLARSLHASGNTNVYGEYFYSVYIAECGPITLASTSSVPDQLWADVRNPSKTYTDLWTSYPTAMPTVASTVYSIRELPLQTSALNALNSGITLTASSISSGNTTLASAVNALAPLLTRTAVASEAMDVDLQAIDTSYKAKSDALKTSVDAQTTQLTRTAVASEAMEVDLRTIDTDYKSKSDALNTTMGNFSTTFSTKQDAIKTSLDTGNTACSALNSTLGSKMDTLKAAVDSGTTAQTAMNTITQSMSLGLGAAFDGAFGTNGTVSTRWTAQNTAQTAHNAVLEAILDALEQGNATVPGPTSSEVPGDPNVLASIATDIRLGAATKESILQQYPKEAVAYGAGITALLQSSEGQVSSRYSQVVARMAAGEALSSLISEYPDVMAKGAYDLIQLDKLLKTGMFPS
jgi:hypothetical protein